MKLSTYLYFRSHTFGEAVQAFAAAAATGHEAELDKQLKELSLYRSTIAPDDIHHIAEQAMNLVSLAFSQGKLPPLPPAEMVESRFAPLHIIWTYYYYPPNGPECHLIFETKGLHFAEFSIETSDQAIAIEYAEAFEAVFRKNPKQQDWYFQWRIENERVYEGNTLTKLRKHAPR